MAAHCVYCAGPLFTAHEKSEMEEIAAAVEKAGFDTFLPQRDGLELSLCVEALVSQGVERAQANRLLSEAIFALDTYQVLHRCDLLVANLNGRVPDEGTVAEASMAWAKAKQVVGYKSDARSVFGGDDNPLVTGLFGFEICDSLDEIVEQLNRKAADLEEGGSPVVKRERQISQYLWLGEQLWKHLADHKDLDGVIEVLLHEQGQLAAR